MTQAPVETISVSAVSSNERLLADVQLYLSEAFPVELASVHRSAQECLRSLPEIRPHVLLIGEELSDLSPFDASRQAIAVHPGVGAVLMTRQEGDAGFRDRAMAAGARRVVELPLSREVLLTAINETFALVRPLRTAGGDGRSRGRVIAFHSGKGGAGTTFLALNVAVELARLDPRTRVALVDLTFDAGSLESYLNVRAARTVYDLLAVIEDLTPGAVQNAVHRADFSEVWGLDVLVAPHEAWQAVEFTPHHVGGLLAALRRQYGLVVVDVSAHLDAIAAAALQAADLVYEVCLPDAASIRRLRATLDYLREQGVGEDHVRLIVNRASPRSEISAADVGSLFTVPVAAEVPADYAGIQYFANRGVPLSVGGARSVVGRRLGEVARRTLGEVRGEPPVAEPARGRRRLGLRRRPAEGAGS